MWVCVIAERKRKIVNSLMDGRSARTRQERESEWAWLGVLGCGVVDVWRAASFLRSGLSGFMWRSALLRAWVVPVGESTNLERASVVCVGERFCVVVVSMMTR